LIDLSELEETGRLPENNEQSLLLEFYSAKMQSRKGSHCRKGAGPTERNFIEIGPKLGRPSGENDETLYLRHTYQRYGFVPSVCRILRALKGPTQRFPAPCDHIINALTADRIMADSNEV
jgi:hypothetical protein